MGWVDLSFLAALGLSIAVGLWRGLVYEVLALGGWLVAYLLSPWLAPVVQGWLPEARLGPQLSHAAGLVLAFIVVLVVWSLVARLIRALIQACQTQPPPALAAAIERMAPALRLLRHGDGGLALFNGTREDTAALVDLVLSQAGRAGRAPPALAEGGFHRLQAARTVLIMDCGPPPPAKLDRFSHAGTLSFELSVGRDRMIVNCGAAPAAGPQWRDACRATAAHSTLVIADTNSAELKPDSLGRRPEHVEVSRQESQGAYWLDASHDGWRRPFGAIHRRRLYMAASGEDIRGEDAIEAASPQPYVLRFHLHPSVDASLQQDGEGVLLRLPGGSGWRLRADGARIALEESIYLGGAEPRRAEQVVLTGYQDGPQQVKWAITRLG